MTGTMKGTLIRDTLCFSHLSTPRLQRRQRGPCFGNGGGDAEVASALVGSVLVGVWLRVLGLGVRVFGVGSGV